MVLVYLKNGENGKGILVAVGIRKPFAKRITNIELVAKRIEFIHGDAFEVIARISKRQ